MKDQIVINKLLINYYRFYKGGKKTVIFLHGWRSNALAWKKIAELMKWDDLEVITLDLPGFGESAIPKHAMDISDYADVVIEFINKLKLKDVILVGHSFGGRIAIKLGATHPELIEKVVLVDSAGLILNMGQRIFRQNIATILKPFFSPKFMQGLRASIYKKMGSEDYVATPYLREVYKKTINEDLRPYLSKIILPTLIIWGDGDLETPLQYADIFEQEIVGSKKVVLTDAGHFSFIDKPKEFHDELVHFIYDN